jgi:FAD-dependent urate hydroxylase
MDVSTLDCEIAVIGAGPYGLSAASHLGMSGFNVRVFGEPMDFWANGMPAGMLLRSPREASTISDPKSACTLENYESASGTKPEKRVAWETFVEYGKWFQRQVNCEFDRQNVTEIRRNGSGFQLILPNGSVVQSRRVVVAAGIGPFQKIPEVFSSLSPTSASHCYQGRKFGELGKRVAVIGAGQSALESAAILHESGVEVEVIARIPELRWIGMHRRLHQLGLISKALYSKHDVGPIGVSRLVAYPNLMFRVPMGIKDLIRTRAVRSAGAPWLIPRLSDVKISTGRAVVSARDVAGEVHLVLDDGTERRVDHVLLATGYRVDVARYKFLSSDLVQSIRQLDGYPDIDEGFATSVPGLHFIGATAARKFGPLMYFVTGTEFVSKQLASRLGRERE